MSDLRLLLGDVHGKFHELFNGGNRYGPERKRNNSGRLFLQDSISQACRKSDYGTGGEEYPPQRYHDKGCVHECHDRRYGAGLFHEYDASSACHRT